MPKRKSSDSYDIDRDLEIAGKFPSASTLTGKGLYRCNRCSAKIAGVIRLARHLQECNPVFNQIQEALNAARETTTR